MNLLATRTRKTQVRALVRNDDDSYTVPLTRGWAARVDADDAELVAQVNWHAVSVKDAWYAETTIAGKRTKLHRVLTGAMRGEEVRFRNGNPLDCRRANLAVVKGRRS